VVPSLAENHPNPAPATGMARAVEASAPPPPPDPVTERGDILWREFETQEGEGRIEVFFKTLADAEVMTHDMAIEMFSLLHGDAVMRGGRERFAELANALREQRPDVFDQGAHYYLSWLLRDALAESRHEAVPPLARELAARAGRDIDTVNRAFDALAFHGQLSVLVEGVRIAWPFVKESENVASWGITEFANKGANYEIYDYLEHTAVPDPADPVVLESVRFFVAEPREDYLAEFIQDLAGMSGREWQSDDFTPRKAGSRSHDDWDDESEERPTVDPGMHNLARLISEFVGYLRRQEGVPYPRGELVRDELYQYFISRHAGRLDPRPSMLEQMRNPKRKLPKPPRPAHPLCPERVTLEAHLAGMMGLMIILYERAAALFLAMPAWLRFLESRRLIDSAISAKVLEELRPLSLALLPLWEEYTEDPLLYRQGKEWPA
jgi:hypothetical protein